MKTKLRTLVCSLALSLPLLASANPVTSAVNNAERPAKQSARDNYRHPAETLNFFGIKPDMTVVEIWPGGGWYTNILAPLLKDDGQLYAAHFLVDENTGNYYRSSREKFEDKVANYAPYQKIKITDFHPENALDIAPAGSADMVLTFRNVHNWYMRQGDAGVANAFGAFFKALKPGGVLGVVDHRMPESFDMEANKSSGYMKQSYIVAAAEKAGFKLAASSEINANPKDTADHPKGVWSLPPSLRGDENGENKDKFQAIGESDRMTLKFVKPKA